LRYATVLAMDEDDPADDLPRFLSMLPNRF